MQAILTKAWGSLKAWFAAPAIDGEGTCAPTQLSIDVLVAPAGSTLVVRCPASVSMAHRLRIREMLEKRSATDGVKFVLLEADWEAFVIGAPE